MPSCADARSTPYDGLASHDFVEAPHANPATPYVRKNVGRSGGIDPVRIVLE